MPNSNPNTKPSPNIRVIDVGKVYLIHDGSKTGHPGYVVWKNDERNRYLVIRFDSDKYNDTKTKLERGVRHITKLNKPTNSNVKNSYVHNRPMICKRKDIGIELKDFSISPEDLPLIISISEKNPETSPSLRKNRPDWPIQH